EQFVRNQVEQAVFDRSSGKTHLVVAQQTEMAKDIALGQTVVKIAVATINLDRSATHVIQMMAFVIEVQNVCLRADVADLDLRCDLIEYVLIQHIEWRKATQVVTYFDEFNLHATFLYRSLVQTMPNCRQISNPGMLYLSRL